MIQAGSCTDSALITQLDHVFVLDAQPLAQAPGPEARRCPTTVCVRGLGSSWSQPLLAHRPSPIVGSGRKRISRLSGPPVAPAPPAVSISLIVGRDRLGLAGGDRRSIRPREPFARPTRNRRRDSAPPVIANDLQARLIGLAQKNRQQLVSRLPLVERSDQGLLDRRGPVKRLEVAPRFEAMGLGNMPVAELGRLVVVKPEMDAELDLVARPAPWRTRGPPGAS